MIFPRWQFNTSTELRNIPPDSVFTDKTHSVAEYVPITEMDYGSLLCWGVNSLGVQTLPCVFPVIPAGKPSLVSPACRMELLDKTSDMSGTLCDDIMR